MNCLVYFFYKFYYYNCRVDCNMRINCREYKQFKISGIFLEYLKYYENGWGDVLEE